MCVGHTGGEVGAHAKVDIGYEACVHKHRFQQLMLRPEVWSTFECFGFHGCIANEKRAMVQRHMLPLADVAPDFDFMVNTMYAILTREFPAKQLTPYTRDQVIRGIPSSKRDRAIRGYAKLDDVGYGPWATRVSAFVKFESAQYDMQEPPETKAPRLVQHRSDAYCYTLAQYLKPLEHYIFGRRRGIRVSRPWITKGMNSWQIAERIASMDRWVDTCFVELDHSRYDSCLRTELRRMEHRFYTTFYKGDGWFRELLKAQIHNSGRTRNGIAYEVEGTMMSGEYNTSLGDSVINYAMLRYVFGNEADIIVNGDDSVVALPSRLLKRIDFGIFAALGFKTKVDFKYDVRDVTYCQCKPIRVGPGLRWRMVRDPSRVMSRTCYTVKHPDTWLYATQLLNAKGIGELSCNTGVPVLQAFASRIVELNPLQSERLVKTYMAENRRLDPITTRVEPIQDQTRLDFEYAFGITVAEQMEVERWLAAAPFCAL